MKAVLLERTGGPENLKYADTPDPVPGAGEVLVRVRACALNHLDIWVRNGIPAYKISLPHILGCDIAGEIAGGDLAASETTAGLKPGQKVAVAPVRSCRRCGPCLEGRDNLCASFGIIGANGGRGGYAEYVCVPASNVFAVGENLTYEQAAAFPLTFLTAWHMLVTQAQVRPGQTVLVLGSGSGVGTAAIQIAKAAGARVIAASSSAQKLESARKLGADETLQSPPEDLHRKTLSRTNGRGVDVVFEHVGPAVFDKALKCLRPGGILVTCGATSGPTAELDLRYVFSRELRIHGALVGTLAEFRGLMPLVASGKFVPVVDKIFPLREAAQAHEYLAQGRQFGKVVLKI